MEADTSWRWSRGERSQATYYTEEIILVDYQVSRYLMAYVDGNKTEENNI